MKSAVKIFILLLLSCCYLNTVFEFSGCEKKANFENESNYYIHQGNYELTILIAKTVQHFDLALVILHRLELSANWNDIYFNLFYYKHSPPQPTRLFLWHSSLLV